uniref:Major facilitator superfamily (MFS) profile domain-containing protein n=1 Tax=Chromera velia CCMP2878 TaxID=1169474 RepID=A0A0G4GT85_9ALVE|eukprot:Cvel_23222.t1-p1 / transcript=Cvel_23222.t1 / gene=Cvel_23222 / organism=Chromera_velia_CCMP2878 / gene_product=Probable folate-biopterin transporter 6, putative / transcript_product=Probable folate-biopterin transporter 6, putative / location=Cvel_scaffold2369:14797-18934(-) / protein_length=644 / sequence_SO=supercontig / SO=protein_coding / is_pseudo=false
MIQPEGRVASEVLERSADAGAKVAQADAKALPDPATTEKKIARFGVSATLGYFRRLQKSFGWRFLVFIFCFNFLLRGFIAFISLLGIPYLHEYVGVTGAQFQDVMTIFMLPWSMKGLVGTVSDCYPIFGYHKRHYMTGTLIMATGAMLTIPLLSFEWVKANIPVLSALLFLVQFNSASTDVMLDGKVSEFMVKKPSIKADGVVFINGSYMAGMLFFILCCIPLLLDHSALKIRVGLFLVLLGLLQMFYPTVRGWMPEERADRSFHLKRDLIRQHWRVFLLAVSVSLFALGLMLVTAFIPSHASEENLYYRVGYLLVTAAAMLGMGHFLLKPLQYRVVVIMFVSSLLYVDVSGAIMYWFLAKNGEGECNPGGPGFSQTFYALVSQSFGTVAALIAVVIFQTVFSKWTYRWIFCFTIFLKSAGAIFDIIILNRWNLLMGIPDTYFFIFGSAMLTSVLSFLEFMPGVTLMARLSSKGCESTTQATIAAYSNYGSSLAKSLGVVAMRLSGIVTKADEDTEKTCNFSSLPWLITVGQGFLPLLVIPLVWCLIPNVKLDAKLLGYGEEYEEHEQSSSAEEKISGELPGAIGEGTEESGRVPVMGEGLGDPESREQLAEEEDLKGVGGEDEKQRNVPQSTNETDVPERNRN